MSTRMVHLPRFQHRAHVASVDRRLADRWHCQVGTAKARRERALDDLLDVIEESLASGDAERVGHIQSLFDAALAGQAAVARPSGAIHNCDEADATEDVLEAQYRRDPSKATARAWFDALGREGRTNEPAMAALRQEWSL